MSSYDAHPGDLDPNLLRIAVSHAGGRNAISTLRVLPAAKRVYLMKIMEQVGQPVNIIWGEADPLLPPADLVVARTLMHIIDLCTMRDCGHYPMLEQPKRLAEILLELTTV
jgi:pimeloyl-ACP methyl ester carboxylesterase